MEADTVGGGRCKRILLLPLLSRCALRAANGDVEAELLPSLLLVVVSACCDLGAGGVTAAVAGGGAAAQPAGGAGIASPTGMLPLLLPPPLDETSSAGCSSTTQRANNKGVQQQQHEVREWQRTRQQSHVDCGTAISFAISAISSSMAHLDIKLLQHRRPAKCLEQPTTATFELAIAAGADASAGLVLTTTKIQHDACNIRVVCSSPRHTPRTGRPQPTAARRSSCSIPPLACAAAADSTATTTPAGPCSMPH